MKELFAFLNSTRNKEVSIVLPCGYANGYVAIPADHSLYGKSYMEVDRRIDINGGLTFGEKMSDIRPYLQKDSEFIGFNSIDEIPDDYFVYGFDTMHYDNGPHNDRDWCINETKSLKEQFEKLY